MSRRPAAHNPMVFRKTARPTRCSCGARLDADGTCVPCLDAFNAAAAQLELEADLADVGVYPWDPVMNAAGEVVA